jgi:hypothetical protein
MPYEKYYQSILLMLLGCVGLRYEAEAPSGDGRLDASVLTPDGDRFVIEMKYVPVQEPREADGPGALAAKLSPGQLEERMARAATEALDRIKSRKCLRKFQGSGRAIYKAALVVGHYSDVLAVFEKAENWRLAMDQKGRHVVVSS